VSTSGPGTRIGWTLALGALLAASSGAGCRSRDLDGTLAGARELPFERSVADSVWCERSRWRFWSKEDCVDWYRVRTADPERVEVTVASARQTAAPRALQLTLADPVGRSLDEGDRSGAEARVLSWLPEDDVYYVAVRPPQEARDQCSYQIRARQDQPIVEEIEPLPEPVCVKERRMILEVENAPGGARTVIVERTLERASLPVGTRGHLVEGDAVVAEIEVTEVYDDGSRAKVGETGGRSITSRTEAEFELCGESR
jgi:hypothetical protein